MRKHKIALALGIMTLVGVTASPAAASTYTMTDLGSLGGGVSLGCGINATGEVVGRSYTNIKLHFQCGRHICTSTVYHGFSWSAGTIADLTQGPPPPATQNFSEARAVNSNGDLVGTSNGQAFLIHNGKISSLGGGEAFGINNFGEVAGNSSQHAFLFSGAKMTTLPDLSSYAGGLSGASGINNNHQIVGGSDNASGNGHAVMWSNGTITDLGTLGGMLSDAYAINDLGQVVGWAHTASEATHAFLYSNGKMTDLGTFGLDPVPEAINNHGVIVGQSGNGAFVWSGGTFQALNNLIPPGSGFTLNDATAINDNGQIVANGYNSTGQTHTFLLTPTG
jgi:probable HAF family extracellular repeat protein